MRWRLTLLVAATTSAVVLAFLVPLTLLLRSLAEERTITTVTTDAQNLAALAAASGTSAVKAELADAERPRLGTITIVMPSGEVLGARVGDDLQLSEALKGRALTDRHHRRAAVYVPAVGKDGMAVVRTVISADELHRGVGRATTILGALGLLLLVLSIGAADTLARRVSAPIRALAKTADQLREGRLETRTSERGPPEVVAMAQALNRLAARIEQLLISERESVADLSHRLRTPVTALRLDAESITDPEIADRLDLHVGQGRSLRTWLPIRPTWARIDVADLTDIVDVLIDNVFGHTEEGVPLEVTVNAGPNREVVLAVQDGGPGLPGADVVTRGLSKTGSSGLGLDIVRRAAIASGGRLELGRSRLGGAKVQVILGAAETHATERYMRPRYRPERTARRWGRRFRRVIGNGRRAA
jgi:signal transduction histidine kinase